MKNTWILLLIVTVQIASNYSAFAQRERYARVPRQTAKIAAPRTASISKSVQQQQMKRLFAHVKRENERSLAQMRQRVAGLDRKMSVLDQKSRQLAAQYQVIRAYQQDVKKHLTQMKSLKGKRALSAFKRFEQMAAGKRTAVARASRNMPGIQNQTEALRSEMARGLGVSPGSIRQDAGYVIHASGQLKQLMDAARRQKSKRPQWGAGYRPGKKGHQSVSPNQTLLPPYSYADEDHFGTGYGIAYAVSIQLGWPEAPAHAYSQCFGNAAAGTASVQAYGVIGESFQVPAGYGKLRVIAQVKIRNDAMDVFVSGYGSGELKKKLLLGVVGPGQKMEVGTYDILNISYAGVAPMGAGTAPGQLLTDTGDLIVPVSLEFSISNQGGQYSVSIMSQSSLAIGAATVSSSSDTGMFSVRVQRFEIEAFN